MPERYAVQAPVVHSVPLGPRDGLDLLPATEGGEHFVCGHGGRVTEILLGRNSFFGVPGAGNLARLGGVVEADPKRVGARLRAIQVHLALPTIDALAERMGVERNRASGWVNGYNLPPVPCALALLNDPELRGLTLDWLYLGVADALPVKLAIKLAALEVGVVVPASVEAEAPGTAARAPRSARSGSRTASRKRAT